MESSRILISPTIPGLIPIRTVQGTDPYGCASINSSFRFYAKSDMRGVAGAVYLLVIRIVGLGTGPPVTGWLIVDVREAIKTLSSE